MLQTIILILKRAMNNETWASIDWQLPSPLNALALLTINSHNVAVVSCDATLLLRSCRPLFAYLSSSRHLLSLHCCAQLDVGTQLSSNDELLDLLVKVLEFWRKKQGVVTRRRHVTQMNISPVDLALCIVTTVQLARHAIVRRKLAQRAIAVLLNEVALALAKAL
jgi:hypothetical protein